MLAGMRLLATDLDGTLVFHHVVRQADAEALVRWRAAGNLLVLATGRSVRLVQHAVEVARASTSIGLDYDYAVCATGTTVIDAAGQVHCTRMLEADQVRAIVRAIGDVVQAPVSVFASTLERDYVLDDPIGLSTDQRTPPDRFTAAPLSQVAGLGVTSMPLHIPDVRAGRRPLRDGRRPWRRHRGRRRAHHPERGRLHRRPTGLKMGLLTSPAPPVRPPEHRLARRAHTSTESSKTTRLRVDFEDSVEV